MKRFKAEIFFLQLIIDQSKKWLLIISETLHLPLVENESAYAEDVESRMQFKTKNYNMLFSLHAFIKL